MRHTKESDAVDVQDLRRNLRMRASGSVSGEIGVADGVMRPTGLEQIPIFTPRRFRIWMNRMNVKVNVVHA